MPSESRRALIGRGAQLNPANSFEQVRCEEDVTQLAHDELPSDPRRMATQYLPDDSQSKVATVGHKPVSSAG